MTFFPTCAGLVVPLVLCRFTTPHTDMSTTATVDAATPIATTGEPLLWKNSVLYIKHVLYRELRHSVLSIYIDMENFSRHASLLSLYRYIYRECL